VELRKKTGVARSTITNWQHVEQPPQPRTVNKVADFLGIPREEALRLAGVFSDAPPEFIRQGVRHLAGAHDEPGEDSRLA